MSKQSVNYAIKKSKKLEKKQKRRVLNNVDESTTSTDLAIVASRKNVNTKIADQLDVDSDFQATRENEAEIPEIQAYQEQVPKITQNPFANILDQVSIANQQNNTGGAINEEISASA